MKNLLILLLIISSLQSYSQQRDYYVFLVKGEVFVSKKGAKPVLARQNSFIDRGESITVTANSEITLAGKNQDYYVLHKPGSYKVSQLDKAGADPVTGVTQIYLKLVWNELFHPHNDFKTFAKDNVTVYGGVSRGMDCDNLIFPVPDLKTSGDSLHFIWHSTSPSSGYQFIIYDAQRKAIVDMPVKDTQYVLSLSENIEAPGNYYWLVKSEDGNCEDEVPLLFEMMTAKKEQQLISSILSGNKDEELPGRLQAITILEKNGLIPAASKYFRVLVEGNPGNQALLKSYVLFLLKYGYSGEAFNMWQKIMNTP